MESAQSAGDPERAMLALESALRVRPNDHEATLLCVDAHTHAGRFQNAGELLRALIAGQKRKKSPEMRIGHAVRHLASSEPGLLEHERGGLILHLRVDGAASIP
ncbi:MAG: tetratricopeptide repeat protein [Deltaproteobacteria bacterium]|nr:tetratricopeptide repeat protein [Deltaproteobacteria bacterium]